MGMRGPARKPTGPRHQKRAAAGAVVSAPAERPPTPVEFTADQAAVWDRLCDTLERMSLLFSTDWGVLEQYCRSFVHWRHLEADIAANGYTQAGNNGITMPRPEVTLATKKSYELTQLGRLLGLSPSARSGLTAGKPAGATAGGVRSRPRG